MMSYIYMIFFILFIGFLIGMFTTAVVMQSKGMLKPDALDEVLIILGEVYDNSMIPPDAYYEMRERIIALKESGHIKTMDLLQEVSIKRGRREALEEVLKILNKYYLWHYDSVNDSYTTVGLEIDAAVKKLMEGEGENRSD